MICSIEIVEASWLVAIDLGMARYGAEDFLLTVYMRRVPCERGDYRLVIQASCPPPLHLALTCLIKSPSHKLHPTLSASYWSPPAGRSRFLPLIWRDVIPILQFRFIDYGKSWDKSLKKILFSFTRCFSSFLSTYIISDGSCLPLNTTTLSTDQYSRSSVLLGNQETRNRSPAWRTHLIRYLNYLCFWISWFKRDANGE